MRVAIADDDNVFAEQVESTVRNFLTEKKDIAMIRRFRTGEELCEEVSTFAEYDLFLLDVEMPGMNGLKVGERLKQYDSKARIVYITSHEKYAYGSLKLGIFYYILKSTLQDELPELLERIYRENEEDAREYTIKDSSKLIRVKVKNIRYLTKEGKYAIFHYDKGEASERESLEEVYKRLPKDRFVFVGRGTVVNAEHVVNIRGHEIEITGGVKFTMSRFYYPRAMEVLTGYWGLR